jgi:hypothetical protein
MRSGKRKWNDFCLRLQKCSRLNGVWGVKNKTILTIMLLRMAVSRGKADWDHGFKPPTEETIWTHSFESKRVSISLPSTATCCCKPSEQRVDGWLMPCGSVGWKTGSWPTLKCKGRGKENYCHFLAMVCVNVQLQ